MGSVQYLERSLRRGDRIVTTIFAVNKCRKTSSDLTYVSCESFVGVEGRGDGVSIRVSLGSSGLSTFLLPSPERTLEY